MQKETKIEILKANPKEWKNYTIIKENDCYLIPNSDDKGTWLIIPDPELTKNKIKDKKKLKQLTDQLKHFKKI